MADVNPNQDLRFKEIMKRLIPGAYFYVYIFICYKLWNSGKTASLESLTHVMDGLQGSVQLALWIMIVYMSGFVLNNLASIFERTLYKIGFNRPSRLVLTKNGSDWIDGADKIIEASKVMLSDGEVCQEQAKHILDFAKRNISRKDNLVEEMYHHSIMARNILCSHILGFFASLYLIPQISSSCMFILASLLLSIVYYKEWRRKNIVYVQNIFVEYLVEHKS